MIQVNPFARGFLETLDAETSQYGFTSNPFESPRDKHAHDEWNRGAVLAKALLATPAENVTRQFLGYADADVTVKDVVLGFHRASVEG